jgi:hypothetical protein
MSLRYAAQPSRPGSHHFDRIERQSPRVGRGRAECRSGGTALVRQGWNPTSHYRLLSLICPHLTELSIANSLTGRAAHRHGYCSRFAGSSSTAATTSSSPWTPRGTCTGHGRLAQSAVDRMVATSYEFVIEGRVLSPPATPQPHPSAGRRRRVLIDSRRRLDDHHTPTPVPRSRQSGGPILLASDTRRSRASRRSIVCRDGHGYSTRVILGSFLWCATSTA